MVRRRPLCYGSEPTSAQRGCRQPTTRVLDQAAGIGPGSIAAPFANAPPSESMQLHTFRLNSAPPRHRVFFASSRCPTSTSRAP
jgi:hypothetical protein